MGGKVRRMRWKRRTKRLRRRRVGKVTVKEDWDEEEESGADSE